MTDVGHGDFAAIGRSAAPTPGPQAAVARAAVVRALESCSDALAGWEAGSAAFGRADSRSDLDVAVLCREGGGVSVLDAIEVELRTIDDDLVVWDVGTSAFGVQRFWQPRMQTTHAAFCMVDASVMEFEADADRWRELLTVERHGRALPLHDQQRVLASAVASASFDVDAHRARLASELERLRDRRAMVGDFATKELERGRVLDASGMHAAMVVTPLVMLLGMVHRPLRFDFGLRYLHDELPSEVATRLVGIVQPGIDGLADAIRAGGAWIDELLGQVDVGQLPIERHAAEMRAAFGR